MKKNLLLSVLIALVYLAGCQTVNEEEMAWGGLTHHGKDGPMTEAFKANFPNSWERNKVLEILENEATGNRKAKGDKCN
ncbi:hypothetical protein [Echinicola vietnamensis]|uniref:Lipoprotein n=1 Tax=Echinicola vietnamensis (strain DSM 17526 / LMG 23754 / KMM 6221) TaxID=926556 RepID=L0G2S7_ECHVK|nr:hypothetical protein [Echinicola vietnamensis]AGA79306.1 hypothetical protein Echvi_3068 [Echinicola vietnamensis DSM 17526]